MPLCGASWYGRITPGFFAGVAPVQTWLPDFTTAGAVKKGEVEMNAAIALKASKAAGVFRGIKVK